MQTGKSQIILMVFLDQPEKDTGKHGGRCARPDVGPRVHLEPDLSCSRFFMTAKTRCKRFALLSKFSLLSLCESGSGNCVLEPPAVLLCEFESRFQGYFAWGKGGGNPALPEELNEPENLGLHRILVPFNRRARQAAADD
jgi:hypothetical protein